MAKGVKVADGAIVLVTVCLMGAPAVLGDSLNHTVGMVLFWGGLIGLGLFLAWKYWHRPSGEAAEGQFTNNGVYAAGENSGTQQIFHGPVTIHEVIHNATDAVPAHARAVPIKSTSPELVPDMSIRDVFFHIRPDVLDEPKENRWLRVGRELRDKLSTHELIAWGRQIDPITKRHSALIEIPSRYWAHSEFVYFFLDDTQDDDSPHSWTPGNPPTRNDYADIRFNRAQIIKFWPALQKTQLTVARDASLREALMFATLGKWGGRPTDNTEVLNQYSERLIEFRQMAFDGKLAVWGKRSQFGNGVWESIPASYWKEGTVDFLEALREKSKTEREGGFFNPEFVTYHEVMVSRAEFEREFGKS